MSNTVERQTTAITSSAQFIRYLRRIIELADDSKQTAHICLVAAGPRSLNDPAQGFTLIPAESQAHDGTPEILLTNERINSGALTVRLLDRKDASTVRLARGSRNPFARPGDDVAAIIAATESYGERGNLIASTLGLHDDDPGVNLAWITSALALQLDDEIAPQVLALVTPEEDDLVRLIYRTKDRMPGIWEDHDGTWRVTSDVSRELVAHAYRLLPAETIEEARRLIAEHCDRKAEEFDLVEPRGQLEVYRARRARHEAAFQRVLIPSERARGVAAMHALWESQTDSARDAIAESIVYLAPEIEAITGSLPEQLRQIAASAPDTDSESQGNAPRVFSTKESGDIPIVKLNDGKRR
jgi:hypothetical protein